MLVTRLKNGDEFFYLLFSKDEASAAKQVLPFVGDRVEITADVSLFGDLGVLHLQSGSVRRL
jgi:hypothetical protein